MLGPPQAERVDVGTCMELSGVCGAVVVGTGFVVVVEGLDVGDWMGNIGVGYMRMAREESTIAVEDGNVGAECLQRWRVCKWVDVVP